MSPQKYGGGVAGAELFDFSASDDIVFAFFSSSLLNMVGGAWESERTKEINESTYIQGILIKRDLN